MTMRSSIQHLELPFFDNVHRNLGARLTAWIAQQLIIGKAVLQS